MSNDSIKRVNDAIRELKRGRLVILTDDQDREHEGDLVGLAAFASPESVNYALRVARGVLCVPMSKERATALNLAQMVDHNSEKFGTKFTVSVDHKDSTTGVSAIERAHTIKELANLSAQANDFDRPGHIFPLVAEDGGVLTRNGHTEGAVDLAKIAGVPPVSYIIEILSQDGQMARESELSDLAQRENLVQLSIADIANYRQFKERYPIQEGTTVDLPSAFGHFEVTEYQLGEGEPALLIKSQQASSGVPLVRLHSECLTGEVLGSKRCECGPQLQAALKAVDQEGGAVLYLRQEGRGIGLSAKLQTYVLQENHYDTYDANLALGHQPDERQYQQAAQILELAGLTKVRLLTNNPSKVQGLADYGIQVVERQPLITGITDTNQDYMETKKNKFHHML